MTETLQELVADEPPYLLDPEAVLSGGRRRRRTRTAAMTLAAGSTAAAVALGVVLFEAPAPPRQQSLFGASSPAVAGAGHMGDLERVVRDHTPSDWSLTHVEESADSFQADVDDGDGASRLSVGVSPSPGSLQQHPCSDDEFALGSVCREHDLDAGTRFIVRGPADSGPVTSMYVVIVHRDGSGVVVGNDNATWPVVFVRSGERVTPERKRLMSTPSVNRPAPVYSLQQLMEIAKAVDAAT